MKTHYIELDTCTSTNDEAWLRFEPLSVSGDAVAVSTQFQTQGRGRQGRTWKSGEDSFNLLLSIAMTAPKQNMQWVSLYAGVSVCNALSRFHENNPHYQYNDHSLRLKWPNDVYLAEKKLGGILCESKFSGNTPKGLVVGIGLNLFSIPQDENAAKLFLNTDFSAEEKQTILKKLIKTISETLVEDFAKLSNRSSEELRRVWLKHARLKEFSSVKTHTPDGQLISLKALDLDLNGKLICSDHGKTIVIDYPLL